MRNVNRMESESFRRDVLGLAVGAVLLALALGLPEGTATRVARAVVMTLVPALPVGAEMMVPEMPVEA